jgi:hypothetical protein
MSGESHCYRCGGPFLIGGLRVTEPDGRDRHYVGHCRTERHPVPRRGRLLLCAFQWQTFIGGTVSHSCGRWRWHSGMCECRYCNARLLRSAEVQVTFYKDES